MRRPIPIDRRSLIPRSRVLALLDRWTDARLIAIVAPTGYGKSTFTSEWLHTLEGPLSVWLSLEPETAAAPLFIETLGEALLSAIPTLSEPLAELRAGRFSPMQMAQALVEQLRRQERRIICVLDNYELVADPDAHRITQHILDRGPNHFHLVLLSRVQPPLQFSRMLLHDAAIALDERHLRLDHDEFLAFVHASRLAALSESQRAEIERRAEGWIAALRLIDLSIPRSAPGTMDALLGPHSGRLLIEHLKAEVLDRLTPEMRTFLVEAAPLPFLTAELLAAATGREVRSCEALLQQALQANLFLSAHESETGLRYRIHTIFREMLAQAAHDAQTTGAIRRRAAAWLAAHDGVDQALALLLPDFPDDAADLLADGPLRAALLDFDLGAARRWLAQISPDAVDARPQLVVDAAWLSFLAAENEMDRSTDHAQASLDAHPDEAVRSELRAEAAVLQVFGRFMSGRVDGVLAATDAALQLPCAEFGLAAGYRCMLPMLLPGTSNSPDTYRRAMRDAETIFRRIGFAHGALEAAGLRAIYAQRIGDSEGACAAFENVLAVAQIFGREHFLIAVDLHFVYGDHLYGLNRIAEARVQLDHAHTIDARSHFMSSLTYHVAVGLQLCDLAEGKTLTQFDPQADARAWHEVRSSSTVNYAYAAWLRIVRDACMRAPERCRSTFDSFGVHLTDLAASTHPLVQLATLSGAVFGRVPADPATVTALLHSLCRSLEGEQNLWLAHRARAVLAAHLLENGDEADAREAIHPLLTRNDCQRLLLDLPPLSRFADAGAHADALALESLSERERDVLRWFATDRVNKEIARELSISLHTLYAHTQNIYRKLGVHSRKEAVRLSKRHHREP